MSEIYAIRFGANTRKFENFWIFEFSCGPGSRKCENGKLTDCCENLPIFAKICNLFCENLPIFTKICRFLRKFADFCENLTIVAKICGFLRKFDDLCENFADFCANLTIVAKICGFFAKI